jgi:hypothetical protein
MSGKRVGAQVEGKSSTAYIHEEEWNWCTCWTHVGQYPPGITKSPIGSSCSIISFFGELEVVTKNMSALSLGKPC